MCSCVTVRIVLQAFAAIVRASIKYTALCFMQYTVYILHLSVSSSAYCACRNSVYSAVLYAVQSAVFMEVVVVSQPHLDHCNSINLLVCAAHALVISEL
jgi:hypothetical protein